MSETEKIESSTMENEETCPETLEENIILETGNTNNLNESQDFQLVDTGEDETSGKLRPDIKEPKSKEVSCSIATDRAESTLDEIKVIQNVTQAVQNDETTDKEDVQVIELSEKLDEGDRINESSNSGSKSKQSDEDDEIIQCTPPEARSPPKNQDGGNTITSLKRKAGSFDEPPKKILRTLSKEDVSVKPVLEGEESCNSFKSGDSQSEPSKTEFDPNLIIAETQDFGEEEGTDATFDRPTESKENDKDERHPEFQMKDYEIDKNKNFNEASKPNEFAGKEMHKGEVSDTKNAMQSGDGIASPIKEGEHVKSVSANKNTDFIRPVEAKATGIMNDEKVEDKENGVEQGAGPNENNSDVQEISIPKEASESHSSLYLENVCRARKSIELIYDETTVHESKAKPKELVEIDEDGEKIVLDSSQEDSDVRTESKNALDNTKSDTIYKSCYDSKNSSEFSYKSLESTKESSLDSSKSSNKLVNGSSDPKRCDTDSTASIQSDIFNDMPVLDKADSNISASVHNMNRQIKPISVSKDSDHHADLLSVSDNEPDVFIVDDKSKSNSAHSSSIAKALQIEREIGIYVRMKCLLNVDEGTKDFLSKEITGVQCETIATEPTLIRQKNNDTSASLADISGNDTKDASPGSVNSNPQLYHLNPSRLSFASTISSLSSASSAASLAAKLAIRDSMHFSLPRAPAKHAKRHIQDMHSLNDKQALDEAYERISKEWQNCHLLTTTVLNFANAELSGTDMYNISHERIDDQLQKIRSSTPEVQQDLVQAQTPKSTKKTKAVKRARNRSTKSDGQSNGINKVSLKALSPVESNNTPRKRNKSEQTENTLNSIELALKPLTQMVTDELIGKDVFAKWSDNNYYPGKVIDKIKAKYKVNFYDGKNKVLIEDFIIPIPNVLKKGLSVYATTTNYDYGSCGIIIDTGTLNNEVYYTVETDEGEKVQIQIKDISFSADQAQVLKEEINSENKSLPSTPKHLGQITLDNMIDGKRRSKRIATPSFSTPKGKLMQTPTRKSEVEPSVSGISSTMKKEKKLSSESDGRSSDSNVSLKDEIFSIGVQPEIIGTPYEQIGKGPQNRNKSKSRSKKKKEDEETIAVFGPIPRTDSNLFKGMSFILTCASVETIERFQVDSREYGSDPGTENEEEWVKKPFVRDRLNNQIIAGGGKVYTDFNEIPQDEYKNTKLITNVPNTTAKTLLCLSVGIPAYNHNWIIRCCQEVRISVKYHYFVRS